MLKFVKNIKIAPRLVAGFAIVSMLAVIVGLVGILSIDNINENYTNSYEQQTRPLIYIAKTIESAQLLQGLSRDLLIYEDDEQMLNASIAELESAFASFEQNAKLCSDASTESEELQYFKAGYEMYNSRYKPALNQIINGARNGVSTQELTQLLDAAGDVHDSMTENFSIYMDEKYTAASKANNENIGYSSRVKIIMIAIIAVAVILAMALGTLLARLISEPLKRIIILMDQITYTGKIRTPPEIRDDLNRDARNKDEIGLLLWAFDGVLEHIKLVAKNLHLLAQCDITGTFKTLSDEDDLGVALETVQSNLNTAFGQVGRIAHKVNDEAAQIASAAQELAQGAAEQSASVEELSSTITEITGKIMDSAKMATDTAGMSKDIRDNAQRGASKMDNLMSAVKEINEASQNISRVIKVIDDIAFQTNILALNAAVEAARAGQHGKGFAVVAEEVRNLAAKSAEAAKDTGALIESSIEKAGLGAQIAQETAASLAEIVEGIEKSAQAVNDIASSAKDQSAAMEQINIGIEQISRIVHRNNSSAQDSASTSRELSTQSDMLAKQVSAFKLRD